MACLLIVRIKGCAIIIRRGGGELKKLELSIKNLDRWGGGGGGGGGGGAPLKKLELSIKNLDSTPPPPKQKNIVLTPPLLC